MRPTRNALRKNHAGTSRPKSTLCWASLIDLSLQLKQAHWNLRGEGFIAIHELFDKIHGDVEEYVDSVAERIASLGGRADGTVELVRSGSKLPVYPVAVTDVNGSLKASPIRLRRWTNRSAGGILDRCDELGDAVSVDCSRPFRPCFRKISGSSNRTWAGPGHDEFRFVRDPVDSVPEPAKRACVDGRFADRV